MNVSTNVNLIGHQGVEVTVQDYSHIECLGGDAVSLHLHTHTSLPKGWISTDTTLILTHGQLKKLDSQIGFYLKDRDYERLEEGLDEMESQE